MIRMFSWVTVCILSLVGIMALTLKIAGKGSEPETGSDAWNSEN